MLDSNNFMVRSIFWILVVIIFIYTMFPFYWAINSSLKTESELQQQPATMIPHAPTLENYEAVFRNGAFIRALMNSAIVAVSTVVLSLIFGSFAAYALGKLRFPGRQTWLYVILAMTMFPAISILTGLYSLIKMFNVNPLGGMIITYMIFTLPFTIWVLSSFFKALPNELMQAAQVDGATPFQAFYLVLLPLTMPALVTTGLLAFIGAWNEYLFALTFTSISPESRTVPVAIANFRGQFAMQEPFGEIMAATVVVTIPLVILVLIFQNRIIEGMTAGAVKG